MSPDLRRRSRANLRLFVNSQLLRGVRESSDVTSMPEEKRALAIRAMRNAQRCLEICLRGENVRPTQMSTSSTDDLVSKRSALRRALHP
jgi:hypothetical protein